MLLSDVAAFQMRWGERIAEDPLAKRVIAELWQHREEHIRPVLDFARAQNPILDPVIRSEPVEMTQHIADHFYALLALPSADADARSGNADATPLDFVVRHGIRRALAGVPLRAVLQAYRSGHRSFWSVMCAMIDRLSPEPVAGMRTTMLLSDYCIDYTDLISLVLTDAYVAEENSLASERARLTSTVVDDLLRGEQPARDLERQLCEHSGLLDGNAMVVVIARIMEPRGAGSRREHRELATLLERVLPADRFGRLVESRPDEVVALVAGRTTTGEHVTQALRGAATTVLRTALASLRIGVGLDVETLAKLPLSYAQARVALELKGNYPRIRHLREVDVHAYFNHTADATARLLLPVMPEEVTSEPLAGTLAAFAAANLNVKECARQLQVHTNTIYYRLNRVQKLTGLDPRSFAALAQLLTALQARS